MKSDRTGDRQYGALVWRRSPVLEILLLTSRGTGRWVIPKGWPMVDCSAGECAAQEAYEEAGVEGAASPEPIGSYTYAKVLKDGSVRGLTVEVHPLKMERELADWPEATERIRRWLPPKEAAAVVEEPGLSELITAFAAQTAPPRT